MVPHSQKPQEFFHVVDAAQFRKLLVGFPALAPETIALDQACGRVLAAPAVAGDNLPLCDRSSMDGYAVFAQDTFGAGEQNPAYLELAGSIAVDKPADFTLAPGTCAAITTGGCLPPGADAVVMVEHTDAMAGTIEIRRAVAPGENVMLAGEDVAAGQEVLPAGTRLRPQEIGMLAALGLAELPVATAPRCAVISTGDEVVPVTATPRPGQVRDVNAHTLAALAAQAGAVPSLLPHAPDKLDALTATLAQGLAEHDAVLVSGGSSVGVRDLTVAAILSFPDAEVLAHGVSVSPGKPTILARIGSKPVLGLPGQVTSAQVVMRIFVQPFLLHLQGVRDPFARPYRFAIPAKLSRNLASRQGREDYVRVRLLPPAEPDGLPLAEPVLGKSGLLKTLLAADGLVRIPANREGLLQNARVDVLPFEG